jgi:hypothetical protein
LQEFWHTPDTMTARRPSAFLVFLLFLSLTVVVYQPGLSGDYMFDDMQNLLVNSRLTIDTLDLDALQSASLSTGSGIFRRPLSMLSFALNRYYTGIDPFFHKIVNLVIHLLTGTGLLLLTRKILKVNRKLHTPAFSPAIDTWLPVLISAVWLVHPLNLTSVLYIVQRMTSLSALFTVCGLYCYLAGRQRLLDGRSGWPLITTGLALFGALAFLSKENGALLPLYMFALEAVLFRFRARGKGVDRGIAAFFALILALPAAGVLALLAIAPDTLLGGYSGRDFTLVERILTQMRVLVFYLKQLIAPSISELGLYHDDIPLSHSLLDPPATLYAGLALSVMLLTALLIIRKLPLVSLGIIWFFFGHMMESTILPLEIAHEHRNYLPGFGIILAAGAALAHLQGHRLAPLIRTVAPGVFLIMFASVTWVRAGQWSDNVNHAVYEAMHHPESPRSVFAAGRIHARLALAGNEESIDKAFQYLQNASRLDSTGILPDVVMVKLASILKQPVKQEWYDTIVTKLAYPLSAADLNALYTLVTCQRNACATPPDTMKTIYQTIFSNNTLRGANKMANAYAGYGTYLINSQGDTATGLEYFIKAVDANPREAQYWINLLKLLVKMRHYDTAEQWLERFRMANPYGATENDFMHFRQVIDDGRDRIEQAAASSNRPTP